MQTIPIQSLPLSAISDHRRRQLVHLLAPTPYTVTCWDWQTDSSGRCKLLIWRFQKSERFHLGTLEDIRAKCAPTHVFDEMDLFCVTSNSPFDDEEDEEPVVCVPCQRFDADVFYEQI